MKIDDRLRELRELESRHRERETLHGGGGGGTSDGMEPRIARLESDMEHVKKAIERIDGKLGDITTLKVDVATLKERVAHLPTKDELGTKLRTYFTIAVSVIGVMIAGATFAVRALGS